MKQKLKSIRNYFTNLLPRRFKMAKNQLRQYQRKGHIYFKPLYYNPSINVGYIIIHKVLSTSLCKMMLDRENIYYKKYQEHNVHHSKFFTISPISENIFSFAFVRNPFAKLASVYKSKYDINSYQVFDIYAFGLLLGKYRVKNFEHFVKIICKIPEHLLESHIAKQYSILYDNGKCRVKFVGKMENLSEDWQYIQSQVDIPNLPHSNKTEKTDWRDFYNLELAEMVYQYYKEDFQAFGYTDEYEKLVTYIKNRKDKPKGKNWWEISPLAKDRYPQ